MTIPEKLKIGAKVYGVEITNKLDLGNVNYSGAKSPTPTWLSVSVRTHRQKWKPTFFTK